MKKLVTILLFIPALALVVFVASCTKEGPQGPAGENGINGTDGTATCGQCHNSGEAFMAKVIQWEASVHATGGHFMRNTSDCAPCHTSMGFREVVETGANTTAETIGDPTPINCYTCHQVHETYTAEDWTLRYSDAVIFQEGGGTFDYGTSNLCAKCHQSRPVDPYPGVAGGTTEFPTGTSYRWGPHHGPQANLFAGVGQSGFYEVGGKAYENSYHTNNFTSACNTCHMAEADGVDAGGHTFSMGDLNTAGCLVSGCHGDEDALLESVEEKQMEIEGLMEDLKVLLEANGIMDTVAHPGYLNVPGTYDNVLAGAFYNYKGIEEDRSVGMHNYKYVKKLLENSIAAIQ